MHLMCGYSILTGSQVCVLSQVAIYCTVHTGFICLQLTNISCFCASLDNVRNNHDFSRVHKKTKVSRHIPIIYLLPLSMEKCEEGARKLIPSGYVSQGLNALRTHDKALKHLIGNSPVPPKDHCNCSFQIRKYD